MKIMLANKNMKSRSIVPSLKQLTEEIPHSKVSAETVSKTRKLIAKYITGQVGRNRILAIVGPCAIHDPAAALNYARKLAELSARIKSHITVLMRVNGEKPRTRKGWDGYAIDPLLDKSLRVDIGFRNMRTLMCSINSLGLPVATEALFPLSFNVVSDMVSYAWIGARNIEDTNSRSLASGLSMPVGMKNPVHGPLSLAINAIDFAQSPGYIFAPDANNFMDLQDVDGNPCPHLILRGNGHGPNYDPASIKKAREELRAASLHDRLIVDCSHGNCEGHYHKQKEVVKSIIQQIKDGETGIAGFMLESYIKAGKQKIPELGTKDVNLDMIDPDLSVIDACLSWEETEETLLAAYDELRKIRN